MLSQDIAERMIMYPAMGYYYVGFLDDAPPEKIHFHLNDRFHLLGSPDDYQSVCIASKIESIFLIKRDIAHIKQRELIQFSLDHGIQLNVLSEPILDTPFIDARVFDGMPMISTTNFDHRVIEQWVKRLGDIIVSSLALVVLFQFLLWFQSGLSGYRPKGQYFFKQTRVGQHGQLFHMIKFRSMIPNAEASTGPVMVDESGDARYIKGGQFIRQFSLDELPQFWNVLCGQMSLVGPRPERPHFVDQFSKIVPYFNERHVVPVGMSGWAQINGRSVLTRRPEHKIKYDIYYINHWSVLFDIKILIKTLFVVFKGGIILMNVVVFGGAFDPLHNGHVDIVFYLSGLGYDRLCLVPTGVPIYKDATQFSANDRLAMLQLVFGDDPLIDILTVELQKNQPSYTVDTMSFLFDSYGATSVKFCCWFGSIVSISSMATI